MAVYKEPKTNTWRVIYRYTDWNGERKQSQKRGFQTKREAQSWEREQLNKLGSDLDMTFRSFVEHYEEDRRSRIKDSTWESKEHIIRTKLLPYFGKLKMSSITPQQIVRWQNELINYRDKGGVPYSPVYLKSIQNQISAIFNHAVRYYNLKENPCKKAGSMGKKKHREMAFWTKEEYLQFIDAMMDKPLSFYAKQLGAGLDEQLEKFIREHPDTRLIIIDTLQKIREVSTDAYSYANDYDIVGRMKQFADKNGVCLLLVHHTRKQQAGDKFEMISGTTGLLGCADGAFLLQKEKRTDLNSTLEIVGRDQPDQKLHLTRDAEKLTWQLDHAETELWKKPPDPLLSKLAAVIAGDTPAWNGSATELVALLGEDMQPNILTRRLNVKAGELLNEYGIEYTVKRTRSGSFISLARKAV